MQGHLTVLDSAPWILHSGFFVSGTWIQDSNYKWDLEYLTFLPLSERKISQIPDSLTLLEIFVPILAKLSVPSFRSLISSSIARSFGIHFRSRVLVRIWPFAEEWVLGEFFPLKNKFLQISVDMRFAWVYIFLPQNFPCTFNLLSVSCTLSWQSFKKN